MPYFINLKLLLTVEFYPENPFVAIKCKFKLFKMISVKKIVNELSQSVLLLRFNLFISV